MWFLLLLNIKIKNGGELLVIEVVLYIVCIFGWLEGFVMFKKGNELWSVNVVVVGLFGLDRD